MDARPHIEAELARLERRLPVLTGQCELTWRWKPSPARPGR